MRTLKAAFRRMFRNKRREMRDLTLGHLGLLVSSLWLSHEVDKERVRRFSCRPASLLGSSFNFLL